MLPLRAVTRRLHSWQSQQTPLEIYLFRQQQFLHVVHFYCHVTFTASTVACTLACSCAIRACAPGFIATGLVWAFCLRERLGCPGVWGPALPVPQKCLGLHRRRRWNGSFAGLGCRGVPLHRRYRSTGGPLPRQGHQNSYQILPKWYQNHPNACQMRHIGRCLLQF